MSGNSNSGRKPETGPGAPPATVLPTNELAALWWDAGFAAALTWRHRHNNLGLSLEYLIARHADEVPRNPLAANRELHMDDLAVASYAQAMSTKLALARHKGRGGWQDRLDYDYTRLCRDLLDHVVKGDPVDVGNFAMFLYHRGEKAALPSDVLASLPSYYRLKG